MAVKIDKNKIDINSTLVKLTFILKGNREKLEVDTTLSQACDFVDILNDNKGKHFNKAQKEMMENKFYIFDDIIHKKTVGVSLKDVKYLEIPYFIDKKDKFDIKILTVN